MPRLDTRYIGMLGLHQCQDWIATCTRGIAMDLDWLKDFLALAEQGNFSRAADARNVTQPAFSRRIRALEDWVGAPLFERGAQGATLTAAGTHFRPLADDMMRTLDRARRDTKAVGERETATLSIAATHTLSFTFFPGWIRESLGLEAFGALTLISDSLEACEEIMLGGEVHFLLPPSRRCTDTLRRRAVRKRLGRPRHVAPRMRPGRRRSATLDTPRRATAAALAGLQPCLRPRPHLGSSSARGVRRWRHRVHIAPRCSTDDDGARRPRRCVASAHDGGRRSVARQAPPRCAT